MDNPQVSQNELRVLLRELSVVVEAVGEGSVVELGCYTGGSAAAMAICLEQAHSKWPLHVYDSFMGLPIKNSLDNSPAGHQFTAGVLHATKAELVKTFRRKHAPLPFIHKAWFDDLTPADLPEHIRFAFLDCDYYDSIMTSLRLVWPKLAQGAVVVVDDYRNESLPGVAKAVDAWLLTHPGQLRVEASLAIIYPRL